MYILRYNSFVTEHSIAEAARQLSTIVDEAIEGQAVLITRDGREVAVVVSAAEFERLRAGKKGFREAYAAYRAEYPEGDTEDGNDPLGPEFWDSLRDRSPGPDVSL